MDKKIPPLPPRRPIPPKPNIVRTQTENKIIQQNIENSDRARETENKNSTENIKKVESNIENQRKVENNIEVQKKVDKIEKSEPQNAEIQNNVQPKVEKIEKENNIQPETKTVIKDVKPQEDMTIAKLNEKYKTILLSILSALCFVGAIACFVIMVL